MTQGSKRITFEEAAALYPDEWIVFTDPRIDAENTEFVDGVVFFHGRDRDEALDRCAEVEGDTALEFTGKPRYRKVSLSTDAQGDASSKAA